MSLTLQQLVGRLSFRQLQVFQAVYELRGYRKAAEMLGLTQPAVSSQIKKLEDAVGFPLFEFIGRKIYATEAGERVAVCVGQIFEQVEHLQSELLSLEGRLSGDLRLSVVNTVQYAVPYLLKGFIEQYPSVNISVRVVNRAMALSELSDNSGDLFLMGLVPNDRSLSSLPFLDNELIPIVATEHTLAKRKQVSPQQFLDAKLLTRELGSGSRLALEQHCQNNRLSFEPYMQLGSNDAVKYAVMAGLGVAVVPKLSVISELRIGSLKELNVKGFPLRRSWCLVHPTGKHHTPATQAFIDYVMGNLKDINDHFKELRKLS